MKEIQTLTTGYRRGYVRVAERGIEENVDIKSVLEHANKNSNLYRKVKALVDRYGATRVTVCSNQHANSSQYCYDIYTGYAN